MRLKGKFIQTTEPWNLESKSGMGNCEIEISREEVLKALKEEADTEGLKVPKQGIESDLSDLRVYPKGIAEDIRISINKIIDYLEAK